MTPNDKVARKGYKKKDRRTIFKIKTEKRNKKNRISKWDRKVIYEKAKSINISSFTDMQLNVDGEYGGKLPANFLNLERNIDVFTPHDIHNEELIDQPTVTPQMKAEDYQHNSEDEV